MERETKEVRKLHEWLLRSRSRLDCSTRAVRSPFPVKNARLKRAFYFPNMNAYLRRYKENTWMHLTHVSTRSCPEASAKIKKKSMKKLQLFAFPVFVTLSQFLSVFSFF